MHKQLNQEIQNLKEELDKREQEIFKYKSSLNNTIVSSNNNHSGHHGHGHAHHSGNFSNLASGLQTVGNLITNAALNLQNIHGSPMNSTANLSNFNFSNTTAINLDDTIEFDNQDRLESWLSIPNKRNIKKYGWKKLYVVLRKGKLYFYNSLKDHQSQEPYMTIDLE